MGNESLYDLGWRQGDVLKTPLPFLMVKHLPNSETPREMDMHDAWVVATQDCSLARARIKSNAATIELRQVHHEDPPESWGIRARKFLLSSELGHYIIDDKPITSVSPKFLISLDPSPIHYKLPAVRVLALKTWLGNRYDRPAVPEEYVKAAQAIAGAVGTESRLNAGHEVRDVYMSFAGNESELSYSIFAVMTDDADRSAVRNWLAEAALEIDDSIGKAVQIEALFGSETTLDMLENSYCADLSQLTWGNGEQVDGAY